MNKIDTISLYDVNFAEELTNPHYLKYLAELESSDLIAECCDDINTHKFTGDRETAGKFIEKALNIFYTALADEHGIRVKDAENIVEFIVGKFEYDYVDVCKEFKDYADFVKKVNA